MAGAGQELFEGGRDFGRQAAEPGETGTAYAFVGGKMDGPLDVAGQAE